MAPLSSMLLLPTSLLALVSQATANQRLAAAVKKLSLDPSEKIFPEHLAFAPLPVDAVARVFLDEQDDAGLNGTARLYRPAFARHHDDAEDSTLRRAAAALALLRKRASCPAGMNSCADQGSPNKCCQQGTYCTDVPDTTVGHVACCPQGTKCGGGVGSCPADAVSCPADLGGGCCISGYVCQGVGCKSRHPARIRNGAPAVILTAQVSRALRQRPRQRRCRAPARKTR